MVLTFDTRPESASGHVGATSLTRPSSGSLTFVLSLTQVCT